MNSNWREESYSNDRITVSVSVTDGQSDPVSLTSEGVSLKNRSPLINSVTLFPLSPNKSTPVKAKAEVTDSEGDPVTISYDWYVNSSLVKSGASDSLDPSFFQRGDFIVVEVQATDNNTESISLRSNPLEVMNSNPKITSTAPAAETPYTYSYQVTASDPDNDSLTFSIEGPPGMTIDPYSGLISWNFKEAGYGNYSVKVIVEDELGAQDFQIFTLQLDRALISPTGEIIR